MDGWPVHCKRGCTGGGRAWILNASQSLFPNEGSLRIDFNTLALPVGRCNSDYFVPLWQDPAFSEGCGIPGGSFCCFSVHFHTGNHPRDFNSRLKKPFLISTWESAMTQMNRRDFLKLAGLFSSFLLLP